MSIAYPDANNDSELGSGVWDAFGQKPIVPIPEDETPNRQPILPAGSMGRYLAAASHDLLQVLQTMALLNGSLRELLRVPSRWKWYPSRTRR